jgi:predicted MFS family arabinose efflux permease
MLPLSLFRNHNFSVGNVATLFVYAGLGASTFLIVVFLQQVAGYSALAAGMAMVPVTVIMFFLSSRFGALSGRYGPRLFMGIGPLVSACGFLLMLRIDENVAYWTQLFPAVVIFGLGLSITVAPLTAAILGDVRQEQAGIASAINNAVARIAGLVAVAAVGAVIAAQFGSTLTRLDIYQHFDVKAEQQNPLQRPKGIADTYYEHILTESSVAAFHSGIFTIAALMAAGGAVSLAGIRNPRKP